jgi:hypothetical protein
MDVTQQFDHSPGAFSHRLSSDGSPRVLRLTHIGFGLLHQIAFELLVEIPLKQHW